MVLIELHTLYGSLWINPNYISSFCAGAAGGTNVFMANDTSPVQVKEEPEEILELIKKALSL